MSLARLMPHFQRSAVVVGVVLLRTQQAECERPKPPQVSHETMMESMRPKLEEYEHIDWNVKKNEKLLKNHALFQTLYGEGMIEAYEVYKHTTKPEIVILLKFGNKINGYPGILHGGISALVIDNSYGMLFMSLGLPPAFTANLDLNYRSPVQENSYCILRSAVDSIDGRKLRMRASIEDASTRKVQVESTTLFINMKIEPWQLWIKQVIDYFS